MTDGIDRDREATLERADLQPDPMEQFRIWMDAAVAAETIEPAAMTLATADREGTPSARIVLLRGVDAGGFVWYGNRTSQKGRDLVVVPRAALVFHWERLQRQVRVSGHVSVIAEEESAAYFASRARKSQLSAWASHQGSVLAERAELKAATARIGEAYPEKVPLPPFWGGYRLEPAMVEFWQGRRDRMHDRFRYLREGSGWHIDRLAP